MATRAVNFNCHGHRETRATSSQSSSASSGRERRRQGKRKMLDKIAALERRVCDLQHRDDESNARIAALTEQLSTSRRQQESLRGVITALQSSADHSGHAKPLEPQPLVFDLFTMETAEASVQTSISFHHQCADKFFTVGGDGRPAVLDLGATHSAADAAAGGLLATPAFALEQHGQAVFGIPPSASLDSSLLCAQRDGGGECAEMRVLGPQARKTPGGRVLAVSHCPVDTAIGATTSLDVAGTTTAEQNEPSLASSGSKGEGTSLTTPASHIKANVPPASVGSQPSLTRAGAPGIVSARIRDKTRDALAQYEHPSTEAVASEAPDTPSYVSARIRDKTRDETAHDEALDEHFGTEAVASGAPAADDDARCGPLPIALKTELKVCHSHQVVGNDGAVKTELLDAHGNLETQCGPLHKDFSTHKPVFDFNSQHLANLDGPLPPCASAEQPAETLAVGGGKFEIMDASGKHGTQCGPWKEDLSTQNPAEQHCLKDFSNHRGEGDFDFDSQTLANLKKFNSQLSPLVDRSSQDFDSHNLANVEGPLPTCASTEQTTEHASPVLFDANTEVLAVGGALGSVELPLVDHNSQNLANTHEHTDVESGKLPQLWKLRAQLVDSRSLAGNPAAVDQMIAIVDSEIASERECSR